MTLPADNTCRAKFIARPDGTAWTLDDLVAAIADVVGPINDWFDGLPTAESVGIGEFWFLVTFVNDATGVNSNPDTHDKWTWDDALGLCDPVWPTVSGVALNPPNASYYAGTDPLGFGGTATGPAGTVVMAYHGVRSIDFDTSTYIEVVGSGGAGTIETTGGQFVRDDFTTDAPSYEAGERYFFKYHLTGTPGQGFTSTLSRLSTHIGAVDRVYGFIDLGGGAAWHDFVDLGFTTAPVFDTPLGGTAPPDLDLCLSGICDSDGSDGLSYQIDYTPDALSGGGSSLPDYGAGEFIGLTISPDDLITWAGDTTITPATVGVVGGRVVGYLFDDGPIRVEGQVHLINCKAAFEAANHFVVGGEDPIGPTFTHIEVDGLNSAAFHDDIGITNSRRDNGAPGGSTLPLTPGAAPASPFRLEASHLHGLGNGARVDSGAYLTNCLIDGGSVVGGSHTDGIECYAGSGITLDHLTVDMRPADVAGTNACLETQGDAATGGFGPIDHLTITNCHFLGGIVPLRFDDDQIANVVVEHVKIDEGWYFDASCEDAAMIDSWDDVILTDSTVVTAPSGTGWTFPADSLH